MLRDYASAVTRMRNAEGVTRQRLLSAGTGVLSCATSNSRSPSDGRETSESSRRRLDSAKQLDTERITMVIQ